MESVHHVYKLTELCLHYLNVNCIIFMSRTGKMPAASVVTEYHPENILIGVRQLSNQTPAPQKSGPGAGPPPSPAV